MRGVTKKLFSTQKKQRKLSIGGTEQFMLPEIEFGIAQILSNMGKNQESRTRMEALIPYMRLIGKTTWQIGAGIFG